MRKLVKRVVTGAAVAMIALGAARAEAQGKDIVDTAVAAGQFNTLAAALKAAGLVDTLKGAGPFTVFAPTDEAFAKLPKGTVEDLLKPENKAQLENLEQLYQQNTQIIASSLREIQRFQREFEAVKAKVAVGRSLENLAGMMKGSISELQGMMGGELGESIQQLRQAAAGGTSLQPFAAAAARGSSGLAGSTLPVSSCNWRMRASVASREPCSGSTISCDR